MAAEDLFQRIRRFRQPWPSRGPPSRQDPADCRCRRGSLGQRRERRLDSLLRIALGMQPCSLAICCPRTDLLSTFSTSIGLRRRARYLLTPDNSLLGRRRSGPACGPPLPRCASSAMPASMAFAMPPSARPRGCAPMACFAKLVGQPLDIIAAAPEVDDARGARFVLDEKLRIARNPSGKIGGQRDRFVKRVGVQRLRCRHASPPEPRSQVRDDVVEHVLRRQRPAARLAVRARAQRLRTLRA